MTQNTCSSVTCLYLSVYTVPLIKTPTPSVKGATPRVAPTDYFSLREGDLGVPCGLVFSALRHFRAPARVPPQGRTKTHLVQQPCS